MVSLTLPSIINKYQKQESCIRLKRAYNLLNQSFLSAIAKHGNIDEWPDWEYSEKIVRNYIAPEFKVNKIYPTSENFFKGMCWNRGFHGANQYNWLTGVYISSPISAGTSSFMTDDGICIGLRGHEIYIDINGSDKGPNVAGKDLFFFLISGNAIKPYGYNWSQDDLSSPAKSGACNQRARSGGYACAARIINENWQINYY